MLVNWTEKCLHVSYCHSHAKHGQTAAKQCTCNALMTICWAMVCKFSCWYIYDLDHVLDITDDIYKTLGLHQYLDASDFPD